MIWKNSRTYRKVKSLVDEVRIIDTHEHLPPEVTRLTNGEALKRMFHFPESRQVTDTYGTYRSMKIATRDLYGIDLASEKTRKDLYQKVLEKNEKGLYRWILGKMGGIDLALTIDWPIDCLDEAKGSILAPVQDMDFYVLLHDKASIDNLTNREGYPIHTLTDLSTALDAEIEKYDSFIVAFKFAAAYSRTLKFDKVDSVEAEKVFNRITSSRVRAEFPQPYLPARKINVSEPLPYKESKPLQDYLMHRIIHSSIRYNLPIFFHTGWPGDLLPNNILGNFNPVNLTNLFLEYPDARFICLHGGYPYSRELGALARMYKNVFIEMSWFHLFSPTAARSSLSEWLECVPVNQILAFGGDALTVEGAYGASVIARENIARVLAEKVEDDFYTFKEAGLVAQKILRKNAIDLFHLSNRIQK